VTAHDGVTAVERQSQSRQLQIVLDEKTEARFRISCAILEFLSAARTQLQPTIAQLAKADMIHKPVQSLRGHRPDTTLCLSAQIG
jgi:hypothetical protein